MTSDFADALASGPLVLDGGLSNRRRGPGAGDDGDVVGAALGPGGRMVPVSRTGYPCRDRPAGGGTTMSEPTPSQAEGERDDEPDTPDVPHTTPSQAEGERDDEGESAPVVQPPGTGR